MPMPKPADAFGNLAMKCHLSRVTDLLAWVAIKLYKLVPGLMKDEGDGKAVSDSAKNDYQSLWIATSSQWCAAMVQHLQQVGLRLIVASSRLLQKWKFCSKLSW